MKFLLLPLFAILVACNSDHSADSGKSLMPNDPPECCTPYPPEASGNDPVSVLMYSVSPELLDQLEINYFVTSRQAQAVQDWLLKCVPDFSDDAILSDHAVKTLDDGSKSYYRFFPIFAKFEIENGSTIKTNPENYNIDLERVAMDPQTAPCDIPWDYKIVGYVSASDPLTAEEVEEEVFGVSKNPPQCLQTEEVSIIQPNDGSSYHYLESCNNGEVDRQLNIYPGEYYSLDEFFIRPTFALETTCDGLMKRVKSIEDLEEAMAQTSNPDHKKILSDIIERSKTSISENYGKQEGMVGTLIIDLRKHWDQVLENYRSLNSHLDVEIRLAPDYNYQEPKLVYQSDNISESLQAYVREVPIIVPGFGGLGNGPMSGQFSLSVVDACIATGFTGKESSFETRPLKLKISQ